MDILKILDTYPFRLLCDFCATFLCNLCATFLCDFCTTFLCDSCAAFLRDFCTTFLCDFNTTFLERLLCDCFRGNTHRVAQSCTKSHKVALSRTKSHCSSPKFWILTQSRTTDFQKSHKVALIRSEILDTGAIKKKPWYFHYFDF